jgi:SAM-dependent methyltransferase
VVVIDFGCGARKLKNAVGVDVVPLPGVDVVHDFRQRPYPFPSDYADEIHLSHVLEHVPDPIAMLEEIWRISKPAAKVHIRVPHYSGPYAWKDPTHVRCFTTESFDYFGSNNYSYYTHARFHVKSIRLKYFMEPSHRRIYNLWGCCIQWLLDRHRTFSERFLLYLIGGIDEMEVLLEAQKEGPVGEPT